MLLPPPSIALSQLISFFCNFISCDKTYPSPVPLSVPLPKGLREIRGRSLDNVVLTEGFETTINEVNQRIPPIVHTKFGSMEGYFMTVMSGREVYAFEGIPYAAAPIGEKRFLAPQAISKWNGKLEAKNPGPICKQLNQGRLRGDEDCLRLNIYSPQIPNKNIKPSYPVIIFIHGGAFIFGSGSDYGPAYLLVEDVILVTFNYRLGILGSMITSEGGNWMLKDQAMVINWVYDNIKDFGGSSADIILAGQSAGAVSVHFQMMSRWAKDRIAGAISFSGGAYNSWGLNTLEEGKRISVANARVCQCPVNEGSAAIIDCMRKLPADIVVANQLLTITSGYPVPSIEPNISTAFLSKTPDEAYKSGDVVKIPWITTVTSQEFNLFIAELKARGALLLLKQIFEIEAPMSLSIRGRVPLENEAEIVNNIRDFYGIHGNLLYIPQDFYEQMGSARYFTVPFHKAIQMHSQIAPTYAGVFSYPNNIGIPAQLGLDPKQYGHLYHISFSKLIGVTHADDIIFFFNSTLSPPIARHDNNFAITKLFINIMKHFAENREPSFTAEEDGKTYKIWDSIKSPENINLLKIDEEVKMIPDLYKNVSAFWESLRITDMTPYIKLI